MASVDALRLLRQVPSITELLLLDKDGHEQLRVSRFSIDVSGSGVDRSNEPLFRQAKAGKAAYGPVFFQRDTEPYMSMAHRGTFPDTAVSIAKVNLRFIWNVIVDIRVGKTGRAYAVDAGGRLIAHPDMSLVLRNIELTHLPQVEGGTGDSDLSPAGRIAKDMHGREVLTAHAPIAPLDWLVFVEQPVSDAFGPVYHFPSGHRPHPAGRAPDCDPCWFLPCPCDGNADPRAAGRRCARIGEGMLNHQLLLVRATSLKASATSSTRWPPVQGVRHAREESRRTHPPAADGKPRQVALPGRRKPRPPTAVACLEPVRRSANV